ncbi:ROK family protein [Pelagibacterium sp. H642]|uniref:ROK family protein n=1 Tax=Pelagibacterium sp. H642 TaxID=1881069 RepID=UPI00281585AF|nr:ROK family protein [Pelagibacterium sp. H642]WMT91642.1 ROK family protein [Pelagibacterium sp. H642]
MILALDIGGSAIKAAWADEPDAITPMGRIETPRTDFAAFVETLRGILAAMPSRPEAVSISICGVTDIETGRMICANVPCIDGRLLDAELQAALGLPVTVANDADCFALAEAGLGAGLGHDVVFGIILGTGVGGGLVVDNRLANRRGGYAGEWGHATILATSAGTPPVEIPHFPCGCGRAGCVDTVGGARGVEKLHMHLSGEARDSREIVVGWAGGDPAATRTMEIYVDLIAAPLALAVNITGASIVPVGGGMAGAPGLIPALDKAVRSRILRQLDRPLVVPAQCALEPGLVGAALLGLDRFAYA